MTIATRMMLVVVGTVFLVVAGYMAISHQQRQTLLRDALVQDTQALGRALHAAADHSLRRSGLEGMDEMIRAAVGDDVMFAAVLLDDSGEVIAGVADDLACLRRYLPGGVLAGGQGSGWASCGSTIYWTSLPLAGEAATLVIAQRDVLLARSGLEAARRQMFLMLGLLFGIALMISLMLRGTLIIPLSEVTSGVRTLGESGKMPRVLLPRSAGDLTQLVETIDAMAEQIAEKRRELVNEAEEKAKLAQRLREAEKFAMIGRLSGGLAHEMGSPLSVIGIRAQALQSAPNTLPASRQHAAVIEAQVRRVTDFIQGLLHLADQRGIVFDRVDLVDLLWELGREIMPEAEAEEVALTVELPDEPVVVRGQKTLLRHTFRNLIRNAIHALHDHVGERHVEVWIEAGEHEVRVRVEDTGPGIPPESLDLVFEPFYTTKTVGKGMGLGLPITRGIIQEHGGELYLENVQPSGLRAETVLPLHQADLEIDVGEHGLAGAASGSRQVRDHAD
jgi:two-component system, NtrC family, sensor kinase